ncbi:hypothetical protein ABMA27_007619 [Loxostege sticticalis]|uniref:Actin maturation protease n=1 Tax=Loxostege sticticalis TaxID=481309 RepID=A0ABR3HG42_LOXSC
MCTIPPAPPPPPPPVLSENRSPTKSPTTDSESPIYNYSDICKWASENPQLWEVCAKNSLCLHNAPFKYKYNQFESILQVGPTCGLVALSMLVKGEVAADEILNITKLEGYTHNGEMFSCKYMAKLAKKVFSLAELDNIKYSVQNGGLFSQETIEKLLEGAVLLVPYDADFNHSPCLRKGHTAHWALVCGVIVLEDPGDSYESKPDNVYVFSRHGKSRFLAAWDLEKLDKSNKNLWEFSPKKEADGLLYIFPEGGMGGENGLRNQFLIFEGL